MPRGPNRRSSWKKNKRSGANVGSISRRWAARARRPLVILLAAALALCLLTCLPAYASKRDSNATEPAAEGKDWLTRWDNGLRLSCESEWLKLRVGGKIMADAVGVCGSDARDVSGSALSSGSEWRRLRPYVRGTVMGRLDFKIETEFASDEPKRTDLYLRLKDLPHVGAVTGGYFKEPFGLEQLTSSAHTTFLERALPDAFTPGRSLGFMVNRSFFDDRATGALGFFRSVSDRGRLSASRGGEADAITGRGTWLVWDDRDKNELLHLGAAYSYRDCKGRVRYRQRPEVHFLGHVTHTGRFLANHTHLVGAEAAWVRGPLSIQGEYMASCVDRPDSANAFLQGVYVQASYFLTGEHRPYDRATGTFKGPKPWKAFPTRGCGAWEVAARYSFLDLTGSGLAGTARRVQDITIGMNWYWNPNIRLVWNYIHSYVDGFGSSGSSDMFLLRVQLAF